MVLSRFINSYLVDHNINNRWFLAKPARNFSFVGPDRPPFESTLLGKCLDFAGQKI